MWRFALVSMLVLLSTTFANAQDATGRSGKPGPHAQSLDGLPTNCAGLAVTLKAEIDRMKGLQKRSEKEEKAPPTNLVSAWQRLFGKKGDGNSSLKELTKARERGDDLNAALNAIGCPTIDIDRALTR